MTVSSWHDTRASSAADQSPPDQVHITCGAKGAEAADSVVAAQPEGVVVVVDSTLPTGSYLNRSATAGSGGDPIPAGRSRQTLAVPPGDLVLSCATPPGMDEAGSVTVEVVDPHGYWRAATPAERGCSGGGVSPSWIVGLTGQGESAQQAVDEVVGNFATKTGRRLTAEPALIGYVDARTQTWIASHKGRPDLTIDVTRTDSGYEAGPDALCGT